MGIRREEIGNNPFLHSMWKRWLFATLILLLVGISGVLWYMNTLINQNTTQLIKAGQIALNATVLTKIEQGFTYTGGPTEYVFRGKDEAGRNVWSFVTQDGSQTYAELASAGYSQTKIEQQAKQSPTSLTQIMHSIPGMIDPNQSTQFSSKTTSKLVWEVFGKTAQGDSKYVYYDFYTGKLLWSYRLHA